MKTIGKANGRGGTIKLGGGGKPAALVAKNNVRDRNDAPAKDKRGPSSSNEKTRRNEGYADERDAPNDEGGVEAQVIVSPEGITGTRIISSHAPTENTRRNATSEKRDLPMAGYESFLCDEEGVEALAMVSPEGIPCTRIIVKKRRNKKTPPKENIEEGPTEEKNKNATVQLVAKTKTKNIFGRRTKANNDSVSETDEGMKQARHDEKPRKVADDESSKGNLSDVSFPVIDESKLDENLSEFIGDEKRSNASKLFRGFSSSKCNTRKEATKEAPSKELKDKKANKKFLRGLFMKTRQTEDERVSVYEENPDFILPHSQSAKKEMTPSPSKKQNTQLETESDDDTAQPVLARVSDLATKPGKAVSAKNADSIAVLVQQAEAEIAEENAAAQNTKTRKIVREAEAKIPTNESDSIADSGWSLDMAEALAHTMDFVVAPVIDMAAGKAEPSENYGGNRMNKPLERIEVERLHLIGILRSNLSSAKQKKKAMTRMIELSKYRTENLPRNAYSKMQSTRKAEMNTRSGAPIPSSSLPWTDSAVDDEDTSLDLSYDSTDFSEDDTVESEYSENAAPKKRSATTAPRSKATSVEPKIVETESNESRDWFPKQDWVPLRNWISQPISAGPDSRAHPNTLTTRATTPSPTPATTRAVVLESSALEESKKIVSLSPSKVPLTSATLERSGSESSSVNDQSSVSSNDGSELQCNPSVLRLFFGSIGKSVSRFVESIGMESRDDSLPATQEEPEDHESAVSEPIDGESINGLKSSSFANSSASCRANAEHEPEQQPEPGPEQQPEPGPEPEQEPEHEPEQEPEQEQEQQQQQQQQQHHQQQLEQEPEQEKTKDQPLLPFSFALDQVSDEAIDSLPDFDGLDGKPKKDLAITPISKSEMKVLKKHAQLLGIDVNVLIDARMNEAADRHS